MAAALYTANVSRQQELWGVFKNDFGRQYTAAEEPTRFAVFVENLRLIDQRNVEDGPAVRHGVTRFADMTQHEFAATMLTARPSARRSNATVVNVPPLGEGEAAQQDWTGKYTTPIKDQGHCGSCWAFSAVEQVESDAMREVGETFQLSTQQAPLPGPTN